MPQQAQENQNAMLVHPYNAREAASRQVPGPAKLALVAADEGAAGASPFSDLETDWIGFTFDDEPIHATPITIPPPPPRRETGVLPPGFAGANPAHDDGEYDPLLLPVSPTSYARPAPFPMLSIDSSGMQQFGEAPLGTKRRASQHECSTLPSARRGVTKSPRSEVGDSDVHMALRRAPAGSFDSCGASSFSSASVSSNDEVRDDDDDDDAAFVDDDGDEDYRGGSAHTHSGTRGKKRATPAAARRRRAQSTPRPRAASDDADGDEDGAFEQGRWSPDEIAMVMHVALEFMEEDLKVIADISNFCEVRRPRRAVDKQLKRMLKYPRWVSRAKEQLLDQIRAVIQGRRLPPLTPRQVMLLQSARTKWNP